MVEEALCIYGHPMVDGNVRVAADGRRSCKACARLSAERSRARKAGKPVPPMPPKVRSWSHSPEAKAVMSAKRKAYLATPGGIEHMAQVWERKRGKKRPDDVRRKISEAKTGQPPTAALRAENERRKGLPPSERAKAANEARRGREDTIANARANGLAGKGKPKSEHMRAALGRAKTGTKQSAEARQKMSEAHRKWWDSATDEQKATRPYPHAPFKTRNTYIEQAVAAVLDDLGESFEQHRRMGGRWEPDFYLPQRNLLIEADGWHHTQPAAVARDQRKNSWAVSAGYVIARLPSRVIQANARSCVLYVLQQVADDPTPRIIEVG